MTSIEFSVALALLGSYAILILGLFGVAMARSLVWRKQALATANAMPEMREAIVNYLAGSNDLVPMREFAKNQRNDFASAMISFQGTVGGGALDRLCQLALEFTLVHDWIHETHARDPIRRRLAFSRLAFVSSFEPCRRMIGDVLGNALQDPDTEVRLAASRALTQADSVEDIERVFELAVSQNLLVRLLLAEQLRRHAIPLCERAVPRMLRTEDPRRVLAALEVLVAWERAIPLQGLAELLEHRDKSIRLRALRLAPLVPLEGESKAAIVGGIGDPDPEIVAAACLCTGRARLTEGLASLARLLRTGPPELVRHAAWALAEMPPRGWETLEELSTNANPVTATAASEALQRARAREAA